MHRAGSSDGSLWSAASITPPTLAPAGPEATACSGCRRLSSPWLTYGPPELFPLNQTPNCGQGTFPKV